VQKGGYPDMGSGRYSQALTYKDWFEFNNTQRVHHNYLETLPLVIILSIISGINFGLETFISQCVFLVARIVYQIGYNSSKGASNPVRVAAAITVDFVYIHLLVRSIWSAINIINQ
jgi:uncharacterized membrane protein YecN with MAPEG domain